MNKKKIKIEELNKKLKPFSKEEWTKEEFDKFINEKILNEKIKLKELRNISQDGEFEEENLEKDFKIDNIGFYEKVSFNFFKNIKVFFFIYCKNFFSNTTLFGLVYILGFLNIAIISNVFPIKDMKDMFIFGQSFGIPLISITVVFLPSFLISLRTDSTLKRLKIFGISKTQLSIFINIFVVVSILFYFLLLFFLFNLIGSLFAMIGNHNFSYSIPKLKWGTFIPYFILASLCFVQLGIFLGMKLKTVKSSMGVGFIIYFLLQITTNFQSGGWITPSNDKYKIYDLLRWSFIVNPYAIMINNLTLTFQYHWTFQWEDFIQELSLSISIIWITCYIILSDKIINFNGIR